VIGDLSYCGANWPPIRSMAASPNGKRLVIGDGCRAPNSESVVWELDPGSGNAYSTWLPKGVIQTWSSANCSSVEVWLLEPGTLQYSPDSSSIAIPANYTCNGQALGGLQLMPLNATSGAGGVPLFTRAESWETYYGARHYAWVRGVPWGAAASLSASPSTLCVTPTSAVPAVPGGQIFVELKDASGNVLSRRGRSYTVNSSMSGSHAWVDAFGRVYGVQMTAGQSWSASIDIENAGLTAHVPLNVQDSCSCVPPASSLTVTRGGFVYDARSGHFFQTLTVRSTGSATSGPVYLAIDNLSANASLVGVAGATSCNTPVSPYMLVNADALAAGAAATVKLEFVNPTRAGITYTTRTLAGAGNP